MEYSTDRVNKYEILRRQVEHEDNLIIQRLNWLLVAQGFLFVAYGQILISEAVSSKLIPLLVIGSFSITVTIFTLVGLFAAFNAFRSLNEMIEETLIGPENPNDRHREGEAKIQFIPQSGGTRVIYGGMSLRWIGAWYVSGKNAAIGIASSLLLAWVSLVTWTLVTIK